MRIEEGGAFADVLSGEGDNSWEDEMAYVGRTLGFRVPSLDLRERRLVREASHILFLSVFSFRLRIHTICVTNSSRIGRLTPKNSSHMFVTFRMLEDISLGLFSS